MGARTYLPELGIFTATDPIEGGNTTTYTYPQDPINGSDLDGLRGCTNPKCMPRSKWKGTGWSPIIEFLSFRSWIDSAGAVSTRQYRAATEEFFGGAAASVAAEGAKSMYVGKHRSGSTPIMAAAGRSASRFAARVLGWQVSAVATVLDYLTTPQDRNPAEFAQTKDGLLPTCGDAMTSTRRCRRRFQEYRRMPRRRIWKDGINSRRYLSWIVVGPSLMVASARTLIGHGSSDSLLLASVTLCLSSSITVWGCVWLSRPVSTPHGTDSSES